MKKSTNGKGGNDYVSIFRPRLHGIGVREIGILNGRITIPIVCLMTAQGLSGAGSNFSHDR